MDKEQKLALIEKRIAELPHGYVSRKIINGRERLYLQWRDGDKVMSRYIREHEKEAVLKEVAERKELERQLKELSENCGTVSDGMREYGRKPVYYLKWADEVIGNIYSDFTVRFVKGETNSIIDKYVPVSGRWNRNDFTLFLQERIVSPGRRDIEQILYRCGLTEYDPIQIGIRTHAVSARDLFWITEDKDEKFSDALTEVFSSVFMLRTDLAGDSVDTPEGQNVKRYGVSRGEYGIYKQRLTPLSTDIESETAVYLLGDRLGVPCCPCWRTDEDTVFSVFQYDFSREYIVHFRHLIGERAYDDDFRNLIAARPGYLDFFARMIALDFITRQDDRHLSNLAVKISDEGEAVYPLYDNGRSLFYEDNEETVEKAADDIRKYSTAFGPAGSYSDHILEISRMGISFRKLLKLDIDEMEIREILTEAGFSGYRLKGSVRWIMKCVEMLRELG